MVKNQRLGLTWIGKDNSPRLEPRVLIEDHSLSYQATFKSEQQGQYRANLLVRGDNLLALKALESEYSGKIKCVFIDPPYNTGSAFGDFYDDGLEHSTWLSLIKARLEIIWTLLAADGSLWITIDDNEAHYLKVLCDELFGRKSFVASSIWRTSDNSNNNASTFSLDHNYIFIYAKNPDWQPKFLNDASKRGHFKNPDKDPRGAWFDGNPLNNPAKRPNLMFNLVGPHGDVIPHPPNGWRWSKETIEQKMRTGEIRYTPNGKGIRRRTYLEDMEGLPPSTLWTDLDETGHNRQAKYELKNLFPDRPVTDLFGTPKPEKLIKRVLELATNPGDLVLDSFAGSGTTGAVAHKMGRRWIMVELGEHADTHIVPRMRKVIDGQDGGGVTESTGWQGGGGFRYCRLAPSLLARDRYGQWIIAKEYQPEMLAEAVCKLMSFIYSPSREPSTYWQHGHSTEADFIFVTTQAMTYESLAKLSTEVGKDRTLLVACRAYATKDDTFPNITPKKIPLAVLAKCEWGRDDYSLAVRSPAEPESNDDEDHPRVLASTAPNRGRPRATTAGGKAAPTLFGEDA